MTPACVASYKCFILSLEAKRHLKIRLLLLCLSFRSTCLLSLRCVGRLRNASSFAEFRARDGQFGVKVWQNLSELKHFNIFLGSSAFLRFINLFLSKGANKWGSSVKLVIPKVQT